MVLCGECNFIKVFTFLRSPNSDVTLLIPFLTSFFFRGSCTHSLSDGKQTHVDAVQRKCSAPFNPLDRALQIDGGNGYLKHHPNLMQFRYERMHVLMFHSEQNKLKETPNRRINRLLRFRIDFEFFECLLVKSYKARDGYRNIRGKDLTFY